MARAARADEIQAFSVAYLILRIGYRSAKAARVAMLGYATQQPLSEDKQRRMAELRATHEDRRGLHEGQWAEAELPAERMQKG